MASNSGQIDVGEVEGEVMGWNRDGKKNTKQALLSRQTDATASD